MAVELRLLLAHELDASIGEYGDAVLRRIEAELPELVLTPERRRLALESTQALLREFGDVLRLGRRQTTLHAPPSALAFSRQLAAERVSLTQILRSYRLGQEVMFSRVAELADEIEPVERRAPQVAEVGELTFRFVDAVAGEVAREYEDEFERAVRSSMARRQSAVRELLAGETVDKHRLEPELGRRLDGLHLALVVSARGDRVASEELAALATMAADCLGRGTPLIVSEPTGEVSAWVTPVTQTTETPAALVDALRQASAVIAIGTPARGARGFAASRNQAELAREVADLHPDLVLIRYRDVALEALLLKDRAAAALFATEELGALAGGSGTAARLRATVATYLDHGQDRSRAAVALAIHRNTVARRLERAEELLDRRVDERPLALGAALTIAHRLGIPLTPARE